MVEVKSYRLPPTALMPNSPYPLLHYPKVLSDQIANSTNIAPQVDEIFETNGWRTQWVFRYGQTQESHYHGMTHECMAVLSGTATIRFGVADTSPDLEESTHGSGREDGGIDIHAQAGDVFIIPAGVAHKTYDTTPAEFALLTPGKGRGIEAEDPRAALKALKLDGFTMIGAYPKGGEWNFATGGEDAGEYDRVWAVPKPEFDPVLGKADDGLRKHWIEADMSEYPKGERRGNFYSTTIMDNDFLQ